MMSGKNSLAIQPPFLYINRGAVLRSGHPGQSIPIAGSGVVQIDPAGFARRV